MQRPATVATAAAAPAVAARRRHAADVAVVGNSLQAYAAAYLLAKRGKRTVLIEHAAPQLVPAGGASGAAAGWPDVVLHLPGTTPHLVNEATEALALWRGIEAASGARSLLHLCGSIDIAPARGSSTASDALGMMQDASKAAGLQFGMLSPDEVTAAFPRLRPPSGSAALFTNLGGVLHGRTAAAVLRAMAQRAGADVSAGDGGRRCLLGWRDAGGHFALRTAPAWAAAAADEEVVYECEQLLLLPEAATQRQSLTLFGLTVPGAQLWRVPGGRWRAQEECATIPVWQLLGAGSSRRVDDPAAVDGCWGLPLLNWAPGSVLVAQCLVDGEADEPPLMGGTAREAGGGSSSGGGGSGGGGAEPREAATTQVQLQPAGGSGGSTGGSSQAAAVEALAAARGLGWDVRPGSIEAQDAERQRQAQQQQRQEVAQRRLAAAGGLAAQLVPGVGGRLAGSDSWHQCVIITPDGEPAVGSHPGYEAGRVAVAFPAAAAASGSLPGGQLAPLLARLAVDEMLGQRPEAVNASLVALSREVLGAELAPLQQDSWGELSRYHA